MLRPPGSLEFTTTYGQYIQYTLLWYLALALFVFLPLALVTTGYYVYKLRLAARATEFESLIESEEREGSSQPEPETPPVPFAAYILARVFFVLTGLVLLLMINLLNMFGAFEGEQTQNSYLVYWALQFLFACLWELLWCKLQREKIRLSLAKLFGLGLATLLLAVTTTGFCLCFFNQYYGLIFAQKSISTGFSRMVGLGRICKPDQICHFFATLPEDTSTSVFFNLQTGLTDHVPTLTLNSSLHSAPITFQKVVTQLPDYSGQRIVWCALVTGLTPGTVYSLRASLNSSKLSSTYRTVPTDNLTLAVGGDVGIQSNTVLLNKQLSADVDIIVLGGDIAYDDGMLSCYYSWDRLFSLFEDRFRALNRIIPIIFAVGNHDVGFNSYATTGYNQDRNKNFFKYLPQHYNQSRGVPQPQDRMSYFSHRVGSLLLLTLDSGYIYNHSQQVSFIAQQSQNFKGAKFAQYHNPLYPTCYSNDSTTDRWNEFTEGHQHWVPLFQKYNFPVVLENHVHRRKRTKPIVQNKETPTGVVYIGDGCWGVDEEVCSPQSNSTNNGKFGDVFVTTGNENHFWLMRVAGGNISYRAIAKDGSELDSFSQVIASYY